MSDDGKNTSLLPQAGSNMSSSRDRVVNDESIQVNYTPAGAEVGGGAGFPDLALQKQVEMDVGQLQRGMPPPSAPPAHAEVGAATWSEHTCTLWSVSIADLASSIPVW